MTDPTANPYASPLSVQPPLTPAEEKQWSMLTHVLSIFLGALSAVVLWVLFRNRGPFVRAHTTTEWNWQLTLLGASIALMILSFGSTFGSIAASGGSATDGSLTLFFVGYFGVIIVRIIGTVFSIIAAVATNKGDDYRHPLAIRFFR